MLNEIQEIKNHIYSIRGHSVMLDQDLARLYEVETKYLIRQYKRNIERFPESYAFQLTQDEFLRCQNVTSKQNGSGGRRYLPYAFTEHGTLMLSSILRSNFAIKINQMIIDAFIELRQTIHLDPNYALLKEKMLRIESRVEKIAMGLQVDKSLTDKKISTMSSDIKSISNTLNSFQDGYIIIKRPDDNLFE